jgi:UDP-glucose 4-epimerase
MTLFGDGTQTRAFSHVDDVAPIIARSPLVEAARNQAFNVGADVPYSVNTLAEEVALALGATPNVRHLEARNEVLHAFSDHSKVFKIFSPPEPIDLRTGLQRMAAWVRAHGPCTPVKFDNIEISKNLPSSWAK